MKLLKFEYLPVWLAYLPCLPYWLYLSLKSRSFTYLTATNPSIPHGGIVGESKADILALINQRYLPKCLFIKIDDLFLNIYETSSFLVKKMQIPLKDASNIENSLAKLSISYPFILKPDVGERGTKVELIKTRQNLQNYLQNNRGKFIIQDFIAYKYEFGVFYYRFPHEKHGKVISITGKEFMTIIGNGKDSIETLMENDDRYRRQVVAWREKSAELLKIVLPIGQKQVLEPIGNHCRGTKFTNCNHLISDAVHLNFDEIAKDMTGFYIGRFDLKVENLASLSTGKGLKIMEVNGATSEAGHIYDPEYPLFTAYKDIFQIMFLMQKIGSLNHANGVPYTPFFELMTIIRTHLQ